MDVSIKEKNKKVKRTDLLKFQKSLNEQFLEILSQKQTSSGEQGSEDTLGLSSFFRELNLFISLKELQSIATKVNYENTVRTKSWILGFNQDHGRIYTIFNLNKVFSMLIDDKTDFEVPSLSMNSNIIYLKNNAEENFGLLLEDFKLEYTADFSLIFDHEISENNQMNWSLAAGIDFDTFIKKENMSEAEWELISKINEISKNNNKYEYGSYPQYDSNSKYNLLAFMISKVYLDSFGQKPLFVLNIKNLTKFLINVSPF